MRDESTKKNIGAPKKQTEKRSLIYCMSYPCIKITSVKPEMAISFPS